MKILFNKEKEYFPTFAISKSSAYYPEEELGFCLKENPNRCEVIASVKSQKPKEQK